MPGEERLVPPPQVSPWYHLEVRMLMSSFLREMAGGRCTDHGPFSKVSAPQGMEIVDSAVGGDAWSQVHSSGHPHISSR